ncbi:MAG: response regulator [Mariprofundaceae bacterium]
MNILVIEDEDSLQGAISSFLKYYEVENDTSINLTSFCDPVKGMYELSVRGAYYDVIILDVHMPKLNGDDIYNAMKEAQPLITQSILFITGFAEELLERFPDESLNILHKPFRYEQFAQKIECVNA